MKTHADNTSENKSLAIANSSPQLQSNNASPVQFVDKRPEAIAQRKLQEIMNNSAKPFQFVDKRPEAIAQRKLQEIMNNSSQVKQFKTDVQTPNHLTSQTVQRKDILEEDTLQGDPIQKKENNTGLPDHLKSGIENLSGHSMDDVKVHYNSDKPAQLNAHAYAQGTDIHIANGQEKHLPHEAWHVVQQKQGRVKPTMQMKGKVNVNDDAGLEKEADVMGAKALQMKGEHPHVNDGKQGLKKTQSIIQRMRVGEATEILSKNFVTGINDEFVKAAQKRFNDDVPDYLIEKLITSNMPSSYLPTTEKIWLEFIDRIMKYQAKPLTADNIKKMDLSEKAPDKDTDQVRGKLLSNINEKEKNSGEEAAGLKGKKKELYDKLLPLANKIYNAPLTSNFSLDKLFNYDAPHLLNAFEVHEKLGIVSNNIEGGLADERAEAESDLFFGKDVVTSRMRPRYSALNLKNHPFGAASRNDYGLSHMVLEDHVKSNSTFTWGDTFEAKYFGAHTLTKEGITAMLVSVASGDCSAFQIDDDWKAFFTDAIYGASDAYLDTQIHQDLDIRKDVKEIIISKAEMALFNISLDTVDQLISSLTGDVFIRVQ